MTQVVIGNVFVDTTCQTARYATFDELPARERAQHLAASLSGGKETDALRLRQRCDSVLREAGFEPFFRRPSPAHRAMSLDELIDLAATALINFSVSLTRKDARIAERVVYSLAWMIR